MVRAGPDTGPVLMLNSAGRVIIPGRTAIPDSVHVPGNPAHHSLNEDPLDGATAGVYKFRTQQFNENIMILYVNGTKRVRLQ